MLKQYYANLYLINDGNPYLIQQEPIKATSSSNAWDEAIEMLGDSAFPTMMMVFKKFEENPF